MTSQPATDLFSLATQLAKLVAENNDLARQLDAMDQVADQGLPLGAAWHGPRVAESPEAVRQWILDAVVHLVGSEEVAVYELAPSLCGLLLVAGQPPMPERMARPSLGVGRIGMVAATGCADPGAGRPGAEASADLGLTVCVPLRSPVGPIGVIAVYGLLAHKDSLNDLDLATLTAIGLQAGALLGCFSAERRIARSHAAMAR